MPSEEDDNSDLDEAFQRYSKRLKKKASDSEPIKDAELLSRLEAIDDHAPSKTPLFSDADSRLQQLKEEFHIPHIETGVIFRDNISRRTALGKEARSYIDRGELVPDSITIPMILDRLKENDCKNGWLLDGFPRNLTQAEELDKVLNKEGIDLDIVIEIVLNRQIAKNRIMGRRLCVNDNNHPNNIYIDAIKPDGNRCRICGGDLKTRSDDQDEEAIDKRHKIYYDIETGTMPQ